MKFSILFDVFGVSLKINTLVYFSTSKIKYLQFLTDSQNPSVLLVMGNSYSKPLVNLVT
jgi:hypothetical protein